jgi:hypothetical protein
VHRTVNVVSTDCHRKLATRGQHTALDPAMKQRPHLQP